MWSRHPASRWPSTVRDVRVCYHEILPLCKFTCRLRILSDRGSGELRKAVVYARLYSNAAHVRATAHLPVCSVSARGR